MNTTLPIFEMQNAIEHALHSSNRLIIRAPTGSGKSTQIPQMLLNVCTTGTILVLQPRRLAARMLCMRVAFEHGGEAGEEIGYQTRFETVVSEGTRVRFITEGILPRMLLSNPTLKGIAAVVFDEFHERSLTVDLGLALVRTLQEKFRPDLKLVVMSATLDTGPVAAYLPGAEIIESQGRTFPVNIQYITGAARQESWIAAISAVTTLIRNGALGDILIFMPGVYEIRKTVASLREMALGEQIEVLMLYGDLPVEQQRRVMEPNQRRKVIVSTNISETSVTIPGVRHVIDSGFARVNRYDAVRGFNTLYVERISVDSADQRAGRAGREAPGTCIRLWTVHDHASRSQRTVPEILRVDLAETVLQLKMLGFSDIEHFPWIEPPAHQTVEAAGTLLQELGALDPNGAITSDGKKMAELPMHPRLARLLLESSIRGIPAQGAFAAAILSERPVLMGEPDIHRDVLKSCAGSDFALLFYVVRQVVNSNFDPELLRKLNVNGSAVRQLLRTEAYFLQVCRKRGMHTRDRNDDPQLLSKAILLAYADRVAKRRDQGTLLCELRDGRKGELSKESLARGTPLFVATTIRELKSRQQTSPRTVLSLACGITETWLAELFPDKWSEQTIYWWNSVRGVVEAKRVRSCLGITIEEFSEPNPDREKAGEVLAQTIIEKKLSLTGWNTEVHEYISRVQWLQEQFPEKELPSFDQTDYEIIIHELCRSESRYEHVRAKPVIGLIREMLSFEQRSFVEQAAPAFLNNPDGRRMKVVYQKGHAPVIRARIQDLYGMKETPRIAQGRAAVVIEILAPNMRPVQVTDDLERFWNVHYPELKKALSRRYPKHKWL